MTELSLDAKELMRQIEAYREVIKSAGKKGSCMEDAMKKCYSYQQQGKEYRLVHGKYKGSPHSWCEYKDKDKWLIDDPAQKVKGWQVEETKEYKHGWSSTPDYSKKET